MLTIFRVRFRNIYMQKNVGHCCQNGIQFSATLTLFKGHFLVYVYAFPLPFLGFYFLEIRKRVSNE